MNTMSVCNYVTACLLLFVTSCAGDKPAVPKGFENAPVPEAQFSMLPASGPVFSGSANNEYSLSPVHGFAFLNNGKVTGGTVEASGVVERATQDTVDIQTAGGSLSVRYKLPGGALLPLHQGDDIKITYTPGTGYYIADFVTVITDKALLHASARKSNSHPVSVKIPGDIEVMQKPDGDMDDATQQLPVYIRHRNKMIPIPGKAVVELDHQQYLVQILISTGSNPKPDSLSVSESEPFLLSFFITRIP